MKLQLPRFLEEKHIPSLDGLRAFSIIMVIAQHVSFNFPNSFISKLGLGSFGVNIFFVLSGFLITSLLLKEKVQTQNISLKRFYIRRFLRIIPVAYLFIFTVFVLKYIVNFNFEAGNLLRAMFFCENFADHPTYISTGHYWSLSVEEQFYIMFPFILTIGTKLFLKVAFSLFFIVPLIVYSYYHFDPGYMIVKQLLFFFTGLLSHGILTILTGCIAAILCFQFPGIALFRFKYATAMQVILITVSWHLYRLNLPLGISNVPSCICIAVLLISVINNRHNIFFTILNFKPVRYIGTLSYSLYIWQQIFACQQPWASSTIPGRSVLLNMILLLATAMISYHGFEKQFLKLKDRLYRPKNKAGKAVSTTRNTNFENEKAFVPKL